MVFLGLSLTESEAAQRETTYEGQARQAPRSPGNIHPAPAPPLLPKGSGDKDRLIRPGFVSNNSEYSDPRPASSARNAFLGETSPGRSGQYGQGKKAPRTDLADETADDERTSWQRPAGGEPGGIEEGYVRLDRIVTDQNDTLDPAVEDTNLPGVFAHATAETVAGVRERGVGIGEGVDPSGEEPSKTTLEQENARYVWNTGLNYRSGIGRIESLCFAISKYRIFDKSYRTCFAARLPWHLRVMM